MERESDDGVGDDSLTDDNVIVAYTVTWSYSATDKGALQYWLKNGSSRAVLGTENVTLVLALLQSGPVYQLPNFSLVTKKRQTGSA